jgi:hypothetical protein
MNDLSISFSSSFLEGSQTRSQKESCKVKAQHIPMKHSFHRANVTGTAPNRYRNFLCRCSTALKQRLQRLLRNGFNGSWNHAGH